MTEKNQQEEKKQSIKEAVLFTLVFIYLIWLFLIFAVFIHLTSEKSSGEFEGCWERQEILHKQYIDNTGKFCDSCLVFEIKRPRVWFGYKSNFSFTHYLPEQKNLIENIEIGQKLLTEYCTFMIQEPSPLFPELLKYSIKRTTNIRIYIEEQNGN
jgi:hypothetical protein